MSGRFRFKHDGGYSITEGGTERSLLLTVGIYQDWSIFAKPLHQAEQDEEKRYCTQQEAVRKDVERCFGVLRARF